MTRVEELKELKNMLDQGLIEQDEHARLRAEILARTTRAMPPMALLGGPLACQRHPNAARLFFSTRILERL